MQSRSSITRLTGKLAGAIVAVALAAAVAPATAAPNLQFNKTPDGQKINLGDTATFHFSIVNNGSDPADFPQLYDELPGAGGVVWTTNTNGCQISGSPPNQILECDFNVLEPGQEQTADVTGVPQACVVLNNTAQLFSQNNLPDTLFDTGVITVDCPAMFVIGDVEPHQVGDTVNFWGAQWWKNNAMSGAVANGVASFKGFASEAGITCGGTWVTRPGNSSNPPATIPSDIMVIVTDTVGKSGPDISGTIKQIVVVHSDGGYGPAPGHQGNGVVTDVICP